jgi:hypothetical protein
MDQTDPARDLDPLRHLAEAALARQEAAQRQLADDQAAVDRDQAAQAEAADHTQTLAEAQRRGTRGRAGALRGQLPALLRPRPGGIIVELAEQIS